MKSCTQCQTEKPLEEFFRCAAARTDGRKAECKECTKERKRGYNRKNSVKVAASLLMWKAANPEKVDAHRAKDATRQKEKRKNTPKRPRPPRMSAEIKAAKQKARHAAWRAKNAQHISNYTKQKKAQNPAFRIACNLRKRLSFLVRKASATKTKQTLTLLGCPLKSFLLYLESLWQPGMSWENYGEWHIDHVVPCAIFDLTKPDHQERCFHFSNLQPLWAVDNWRKNDKVIACANAMGSRDGDRFARRVRPADTVTVVRWTN